MNRSVVAWVWIGLAGCAFDAVEHASTVEAGAVLDVTLRLSGGGSVSGSAAVCAGLPVGWTVQQANFTASVSATHSLGGPAVHDPQAAMRLGARPDIQWSCWTHAGTEEWNDASSGVVNLEISVPSDAEGRHPLFWSLGTTGVTGELLSATATSTVRVDSPGHPLDAAAQLASATYSDAVVSTPTGFLAVGEPGVSTSSDGVAWSVAGQGMVGLIDAAHGGQTLWAWSDDALSTWTIEDSWQPVGVAWSAGGVHATALDSGLLVVGEDADSLQHVDRGGTSTRAVPLGAEPDGLATSGEHAVWRVWNASLRQPEVAYSADSGVTWSTIAPPDLARAVGQHDRVGVNDSGALLWANVASTSNGALVELWLGRPTGGWLSLGVWPVGDLAPTTTPASCGDRWVVGLPWGGWLAVDDDGVVSRHALARSAVSEEYLCAGDVVTVVKDGQITGVASWIEAPDLSELTVPAGLVDVPYAARLAPAEWETTVDGLPPGLQVVAGELVGVPQLAGEFELRVETADVWSRSDMALLTLDISEADVDEPDTDIDERDSDTDIVDPESGTDMVLEDEGTDDSVEDGDDTADLDVQPSTGCSSASGPFYLVWPALGLLLGLRRRR